MGPRRDATRHGVDSLRRGAGLPSLPPAAKTAEPSTKTRMRSGVRSGTCPQSLKRTHGSIVW